MNICEIMSAPFPPSEGIGNYVYNLSKNLVGMGHKVTIITRGSMKSGTREIAEGIEVLRPTFVPLYPFHIRIHEAYANRLFKPMGEKFDIVHFHTPLPPVIETSLPVVTTVHTPMLEDTRQMELVNFHSALAKVMGRLVSYPLERKLLNRSDAITAVSNSVAGELQEYGVNPGTCKVMGNGVDESKFTPGEGDRDEDRVLFVGRLSYRKGLFDLIEGARLVIDAHPDVRFTIAGKGNLRKMLQKKLEKLGLEGNFDLPGHVDARTLVELYQKATAFVLPSHYEGLPTVLLEAMSCGSPVVATAISGNLDVISSKENGILVPARSPKILADGISMLLEDYSLRKKLGKNARRTIEERYTWNAIAEKFLECYRPLLEMGS